MLPSGVQCGAAGHPWGAGRAALQLVEEEVREVGEWWLPQHAELPRSPSPAGCDVYWGSNETCREHARVFVLLQQPWSRQYLVLLGDTWKSPPRLPLCMQGSGCCQTPWQAG